VINISNGYTDGEKILLASLIMMDVASMQADNDILKANGKSPKFDGRDFDYVLKCALERLRDF
jgi:hypothetical protein